MTAACLYIDLASPYAYLATARARQLFGGEVSLQPILLGAIFERRGSGSWAHTAQRAAGMDEVQTRARRYGLPEVVWPAGWPVNALAADRAALWSLAHGASDRLILALYHREFTRGEDISDPAVLAAAAADAGLDGEELLAGIGRPELKDALRAATEDAWNRGVRGVPTVAAAGSLFYGDDQMERAAAMVAG